MARNLRMHDLIFFFFFCENNGIKKEFQHLRLLNKMGWLREKIAEFKRWQGSCYSTRKFHKSFGEKL